MRAPRALHLAMALFAICTAGDGVRAQDAVPETPPELRDFRLDPERAQPRPEAQPTTQPDVVTPPPAVPTLPEATPLRPAPRPESTPPRQAQPTITAPAEDTAPVNTQSADPLPEATQPEPAGEPLTPPVDATAQTQPEATTTYWPVWVGLGIFTLALLTIVFWKRRRAEPGLEAEVWEPAIEEQPGEQIPEIAVPGPAAPPVVVPPARKPLITLGFVPEKATVSFTTLTVRGQLQLINEGNTTAKDMQLRAGLISASAQQNRVIEAFHKDAANIQAEQLGEAKPGERIGMAIELSVLLAELQSFPLGDQQLLVPIVVANLTYSDGMAPPERAYIACMIGREATPPQPKMGPLRLDLGPRSFAPLGQRPLAA